MDGMRLSLKALLHWAGRFGRSCDRIGASIRHTGGLRDRGAPRLERANGGTRVAGGKAHEKIRPANTSAGNTSRPDAGARDRGECGEKLPTGLRPAAHPGCRGTKS